MANILITDGIDKSAAQLLLQAGHILTEQSFEPSDLARQVQFHDAMVVRSATKVTREILQSALETGKLKLVIRGGVGLDNIDVQFAGENGITVANTPCASSRAVAELAIAHMFAISRYLHISNVTMRQGAWEKKAYKGIELGGKTLGLIGFGRIARETAGIARALGMNVIYFSRSGPKKEYDFEYVPFDEVLRCADFLSVHVPYDPEKGVLLSDAQFAIMKNGIYLVNCSRGKVISEAALLNALDSGKVAAAGIDVFETEPTQNQRLLSHPRVSLTPHIGASTAEAQKKIGMEVVAIINNHFS